MNKSYQKRIQVYADWVGLQQPERMGVLFSTPSRGKEIFSFEYDSHWLSSMHGHALDPSLQLFQHQQYPPVGQENFGIFLDSSPDCWGRFLMKRREAELAREEQRSEKKLYESDFLLGVYDEYRMGALRFKINPDGPFLDNDNACAAPPWTSLSEIEHASLEIEKLNAEREPDYKKWLRILIAPGGSLGGARPKANVLDKKQHPWIAKFPSQHDEDDIGAWEMLAYQLAQNAKINMAEAKIQKFNSRHHTFLSKRFDRTDYNERIHFASAMTLLQRSDDDDYSNGGSYLELAELIMQQGSHPSQDLEQLWRRIIFYICISNVDDHLRNHGFILQPGQGWRLSPAFDVNPVAEGDGLKLNISETDNSQNLELALDVAELFHVKPKRAKEILFEVVSAVKKWRQLADSLGISAGEQNRMESAFRVADS